VKRRSINAVQELVVELAQLPIEVFSGSSPEEHWESHLPSFELPFIEQLCAGKCGSGKSNRALLCKGEACSSARFVVVLDETQELALVG